MHFCQFKRINLDESLSEEMKWLIILTFFVLSVNSAPVELKLKDIPFEMFERGDVKLIEVTTQVPDFETETFISELEEKSDEIVKKGDDDVASDETESPIVVEEVKSDGKK